MIITLKGANFSSCNIGALNLYRVTLSKSSGVSGSLSVTSFEKGQVISSATVIANLAVVSGYENLTVTVTMGGTSVNAWYSNGVVTIPSNTKITGDIKINASATAVSGGDVVEPEPEEPGTGGGNTDSGTTGNGQWLSVLVTGDKNAHTEFMNYTETIGQLTNVPCAYVKKEIQKHLSGKRVTKVACYVLGSDSSISFYTNDYDGASDTASGDSAWKRVYTLSDPSSKVVAGTKTKKEYDVDFTIEEGDTLAFYDMEKMNSPANKEGLMSYVLPVSYTMNPGGKYGTALPNFIAFDFYVE